ncbi:UDP-galactopyranose mutase [Apibacter muscae]|uniref:UDP-galactopyranose mutase n=1 Tax=Apibacter muscae TaxID=2509004 RepID=UPI0011AC41AE|nr:UDP-galactopyranose mutase [Apibacter muscae]TWP30389.1 UDP-galactopyranose mutase [Apibacter muscae]
MKKYLIVGCGFSGAVVAEQLTKNENCKILVIDERSHIGGNCYSERDPNTNVMVHKYGPHIFNTSNKKVWDYINQFCEMMPFVNRVKTVYDGQIFSMPINLHTINQFFNKNFNPKEAEEFIEKQADKSISEPKNFEEQALKFIGKDLYQAFFYGYTKKQWGCEPKDLPASILKRLPVRFNYEDNYYSNIYQGIPRNGYTEIFRKMLSHPNIEIKLQTKFNGSFNIDNFEHIYYTGPIDAFFNYKYGRLGYRTVYFERGEEIGDFQGNAVINYAEENVPYTRVHEHKHFTPWENHEKTIYFKEFSKETGNNDEPYYPKRLEEDLYKLELYLKEVEELKRYTFLGRLATYRYLNMDQVIEEALKIINE